MTKNFDKETKYLLGWVNFSVNGTCFSLKNTFVDDGYAVSGNVDYLYFIMSDRLTSGRLWIKVCG